jgi:hypothetical protein
VHTLHELREVEGDREVGQRGRGGRERKRERERERERGRGRGG